MKHKTSITLEEDLILKMREAVRSGRFKNKSQLMEFSIKKVLEDLK